MRKLRKTTQVWLTAIAAFSLISTASGQTSVPGPTITTQAWSLPGSPYIVTGDCTIPSGNTLTIEPGVVVKIGSGVSIINNGLIQAVGTPSQHITFQAPVSSQYWSNIVVNWSSSSPGTNRFTYCDFANAQTAINLSVINLTVVGFSPTMVVEVMNCTFTNCLSQAIYGQAIGNYGTGNATLNPVIKNCLFTASSNGCVVNVSGAPSGPNPGFSNPWITGNIFEQLSGTAFLMAAGSTAGSSMPTFLNNTIVNCRVGVNASDPWDAQVEGNIFVGCTNAVTVSGLLSRQVSYNDFYGNATNFTGFNNINYGLIPPDWFNRNGTPADIFYNIYSNPLFVATNDFHLTHSSPCVNAGPPGPAYVNMCFPPSIATNFPDLGAYGGPDACNWLNLVPILPVALSLSKSNNFLWLNFSAIPRSTYQLQYITTNLNAPFKTNGWQVSTNNWQVFGTAEAMQVLNSIPISPYPPTNNIGFGRVQSLGRTDGN